MIMHDGVSLPSILGFATPPTLYISASKTPIICATRLGKEELTREFGYKHFISTPYLIVFVDLCLPYFLSFIRSLCL